MGWTLVVILHSKHTHACVQRYKHTCTRNSHKNTGGCHKTHWVTSAAIHHYFCYHFLVLFYCGYLLSDENRPLMGPVPAFLQGLYWKLFVEKAIELRAVFQVKWTAVQNNSSYSLTAVPQHFRGLSNNSSPLVCRCENGLSFKSSSVNLCSSIDAVLVCPVQTRVPSYCEEQLSCPVLQIWFFLFFFFSTEVRRKD